MSTRYEPLGKTHEELEAMVALAEIKGSLDHVGPEFQMQYIDIALGFYWDTEDWLQARDGAS